MSRPSVHYSQPPPSGPGLASASLPPPSPATVHHFQRSNTTSAHPPGRTLPSLHHPGGNNALPQPQPSYPPATPNGPPMQFPNTATAATTKQDTPDHAFGDRSARGTPLGRHPSEFPPPPQRTPSTPAHPAQDRLMEVGSHHPYSAPHEQVHYAPAYSNSHQPPILPPHNHHLEQAHHMQPIVEPLPYGQPPPLPYPQQHAYFMGHVAPHPGKQKRLSRASLACEKCRERKSRCDEQKPCASCRENNIECVYRDGPPTKASEKMLATSLQDAVETILRRTERQDERMSRIESLLTGRKYSASASPKIDDESRRGSRRDTPTAEGPPRVTTETSAPSATPHERDKNTDFEKHTTAAHKLITSWPSIHELLMEDPSSAQSETRKFLDSLKDDSRRWNHIMQAEARGPLRLYGLGEADEMGDQEGFGAPSPAHSGSDDSGTPSDSPWYGPGNGLETRRSDGTNVGGLGPDGRVDLSSATVTRLFDSYKRHIHRLHPFLDLNTLSRFIEHFKKHYSPDLAPPSQSPHIGAITGMNGGADFVRPNKRKRSEPAVSSSGTATEDTPHSFDAGPRRQPHRSLRVAIVYLVLALGKICEFRDVLPGPLHDDRILNYSSPAVTRPSPSSPHATHLESPSNEMLLFRSKSEYSSFDSSPSTDKKGLNVERIPGLAYYREACSVLGDFADSNELALAQARLLAGLYKGQLARVQESWSWIFDASRICRYWIKREGLDEVRVDSNGQPIAKYAAGSREHRREDMLLLVVWSCLQLESDIAAECDFPHSGLLKYEEKLPYPRNVVNEDTFPDAAEGTFREERVAWYYSAQLFLRKRLNKLHHNLYGEDVAKRSPGQLVEVLMENEGILSNWKDLPSPINRWSDEDPQAEDILDARLRAKYFGACYIQTRFYLDYVLHVMDSVEAGKSLDEVTVDAFGQARPSELAIFRAIQRMPKHVVKDNARKCVRMAINSTIAFDKVPGRLVVTNIMGTAHAQWGNMLVLSAAYNSKKDFLTELIDKDKLHKLFIRTVKFLGRLRKTSKTAIKDIEILQTLHRKLYGFSVDDGPSRYESSQSQHSYAGGHIALSTQHSFTSDA